MIKTYKANTNVSINVVLPSKKNLHISFVSLSNGSSTFTTDNEEIMNAIERHYNFGKLFRIESMQDDSKKETARVVEGTPGKVVEEIAGQAVKRVKVSDLAAAKDYLAENCGISRTALRSEKSIMEQAAANGIEFYGIDGEE